MPESLEKILSSRFSKEKLISFVNKKRIHFNEAVEIALTDKQPQAWRAAWILGLCIKKNDKRLQKHINRVVEAIESKRDGHQRELLKIMENNNIDEDDEGALFDICMTIWESVNKSPSVRITAFRILLKIAKKYPELKGELDFITQNHYTETLSPGILHSFVRLKKELKT